MYAPKPILAAITLATSFVSAVLLPETGSNIVQRQVQVPLTFGNAQWIWTGEEAGAGGIAPIGSRGFRKHISNPSSFVLPVCLTLAVAADNEYVLYVNGFNIGNDFAGFISGASFLDADIYNIPLNPEGENVIALNVTNGPGPTDVPNPAGVIVTGIIEFSDQSQEVLVSDSTWLTLASDTPAGFMQPNFGDSAWIAATEEGLDGVAPWGVTTIVPTNVIGCLNF
ncbi:putative lectin [Lentinula guzmanii]|uniref:Lectin n=1 Tax=Lentinula guzmanii TaxID=2804957 RepID=A0AA38J779_9AGAR|nr:putative lectin [Lentinula guzmanii]